MCCARQSRGFNTRVVTGAEREGEREREREREVVASLLNRARLQEALWWQDGGNKLLLRSSACNAAYLCRPILQDKRRLPTLLRAHFT